MKRIYLFRTIRIVVCLTVICALFYLCLPPRENLVERMNVTVGTDRVDVLCIGASHIGRGLDPIQMYKDNGYAAYTIWVGSQSPWQSYYYLMEACEEQSPKLVILDAYKASVTVDGGYKDSETVNNLLDTPLSLNKICTVMESAADSKLDILLRFPYIHDERKSLSHLSLSKFYGNTDYSMGYLYDATIETEAKDVVDKSGITGTVPITPKNEKYIRKIIEYCKTNGISIILVNAPCPRTTKEGQPLSNYIGQIAGEYDVDYIDGNLLWDKIGIDWTKDRADAHGHLNHSGVTKFTRYVEDYIQKNYDIPDRRGQIEYSAYDDGVKWLEYVSGK